MPNPANTRAAWASSRGEPTRMAPCRSAVTRSMLPSRSASAPWAAMKVGVHFAGDVDQRVVRGHLGPVQAGQAQGELGPQVGEREGAGLVDVRGGHDGVLPFQGAGVEIEGSAADIR